MRSLVQYDVDESTVAPSLPVSPDARRPPVKKRKRNHYNTQNSQSARLPIRHWDDPGSSVVGMIYDEQDASIVPSMPFSPSIESAKVTAGTDDFGEEEEEYSKEEVEGDYAGEEEEEESRELTHEEIWDDSALIDAWNSAEAEYEVFHGTSKSWKTDPIKKSPLWYNKPYTAPSRAGAVPTSLVQDQEDDEPEPDTAPLDFNTFVPTHDPSLSIPSDGAAANPTTTATAPFFVPPSSTTMVSRDEAFNNALSAMYWCGYWTAVYQCQSQSQDKSAGAITENGVEADEDEEEDLVPAQR